MNSRSPKPVLDAFNTALLQGEPHLFSPEIELPAATGIEHLGSGESYDAYLLDSKARQLLLRVARRPPPELPRSVHQEVRGLALDTTGIAPEPIAFFPGTDNVFGAVAVVTSYQQGTRLPKDFPWSEGNLEKIARTLAKLHAKRYEWRGDPANNSGRYQGFNLADEFDESHSWWQANAPELCAAKDLSTLIAAAREYVVSRSAAMDGLTGFSLVHGDLNQSNLLLDTLGDFALIDWEWVAVGDPAQDLASLGGLIPCQPWYAPLSSRALNYLLEVYADCSGSLDLPALIQRRNCWEVHERLWTALHFLTSGREDEAKLLLRGVSGVVSRPA